MHPLPTLTFFDDIIECLLSFDCQHSLKSLYSSPLEHEVESSITFSVQDCSPKPCIFALACPFCVLHGIYMHIIAYYDFPVTTLL